MRGTVAKELRKEASRYGTTKKGELYTAKVHKIRVPTKGKDGVETIKLVDRVTIVCSGTRKLYKTLKRRRKEDGSANI